jgi:hypothetical protein
MVQAEQSVPTILARAISELECTKLSHRAACSEVAVVSHDLEHFANAIACAAPDIRFICTRGILCEGCFASANLWPKVSHLLEAAVAVVRKYAPC